jgi:hypothetical protein
MQVDDDELQDGVTVECPACGHPDWFHPDMAPPSSGHSRCAECNHDLGPWEELHRRLFTAGAMLAEALAKKA